MPPPHSSSFDISAVFPTVLTLRVRAKRILGLKNINIYALGIYVDDAAAKRQLGGRFKSSSEDAVAKDQQLFDGGCLLHEWGTPAPR